MKKILIISLLLCSIANMHAQKYSIATNFTDYIDLGTLNLEGSVAVKKNWSVNVGVKYNPFAYGEGKTAKQNKQQSYSVGAKYWPWHVYSGWWFSAGLRYQEYNLGGVFSPKTTEGDRFGGGVGAGYSYMINTHFNIGFGAGLWAGYDAYTKYNCPNCGTTLAKGSKFFVLPDEIIIAFAYVF